MAELRVLAALFVLGPMVMVILTHSIWPFAGFLCGCLLGVSVMAMEARS